MYFLQSEASFDAAHFLKNYNGKCKNIHGHRWRVVVKVSGDRLIPTGNRPFSQTRFCPSCGAQTGPGDRFCRHCGHPL